MESKFYLKVWRWHFYAGLIVVPFLIILSVTGSIYLFKPQLEGWLYPSRVNVPSNMSASPASQVLSLVDSRSPGTKIQAYLMPKSVDQVVQVEYQDASRRRITAFIDPYQLELLGERDESTYFQKVVHDLHGELLIGKIGDTWVELVACWALALLTTGLFLAWPRGENRIWGVLLPRMRAGGRVFWRDLHVMCGVYGAPLIAILILTGLPWSGVWGEKYVNAWSYHPPEIFLNKPRSSLTEPAVTGSLNQGKMNQVPWASQSYPLPQSGKGIHQMGIDQIIDIARANHLSENYKVLFPSGPEGVFTISVMASDPRQNRVIHIDQYSGKVLADIGFAQYSKLARVVEFGIALHEGRLFGLVNQLLGLFACLMLMALSFSGAIMWWRRKPKGSLGAPKAPSDFQGWKSAAAIALVFSLLFPLVGVSLVFVFFLDHWLLPRLPRVRRFLT